MNTLGASSVKIEHELALRPGALLATEGDSLTFGMDELEGDQTRPLHGLPTSRSLKTWPETLATRLGEDIRVENRGYPGDRSYDGLLRWQWAPAADLTILLYGTNDCFDRPPTMRLSLDTFGRVLEALVRRRLEAGGQVLLLTPPPVADVGTDLRVERYRDVVRKTARACTVNLVETGLILTRIVKPHTDGVHLSAAANEAIAEHLGTMISLVE